MHYIWVRVFNATFNNISFTVYLGGKSITYALLMEIQLSRREDCDLINYQEERIVIPLITKRRGL
jgi:hypothetical protein